MDIPETRYAMTEDGVSIAYSTFGEGAVDLVVDPSDTVGNIEMLWEFEPIADLYRRLAGFSRVILHDRRGCGLSGSSARLPDLETRARDLLAVLDACGAARPALFGSTTGGAALAMFAATYPDRALALAWYGPMARTSRTPEYPWGDPAEEQERSLEDARDLWGTVEWPRMMLELNAPDFATDEGLVAALARVERHFVAPSTAMELERTWYETDVSDLLGALRCPVLLLDRPGSPFDFAEVEYVASLIPVAEVTPLPGDAFQMYLGDRASVAEAVREFLGIDRTPIVPESMLTTVLFTDIVGSTTARRRARRPRMEGAARRPRPGRRTIRSIASADGTSTRRATGCSRPSTAQPAPCGAPERSSRRSGRSAWRSARAVTRVRSSSPATTSRGSRCTSGLAIAALAGPGEILVSSTVKDLTPGSGLAFEDAGEHELKGVPDRWHLYRVVS